MRPLKLHHVFLTTIWLVLSAGGPVSEEPVVWASDETRSPSWVLWARWSKFIAGAPEPIQFHDAPDPQPWPSRTACEAQIPAMRDLKYLLLGSAEVSEATKGPTGVSWWNIGHTRLTIMTWECLPAGQAPPRR